MLRMWKRSGLVLLAVGLSGCQQSPESPLLGTWKMASGTYTDRTLDQEIVTDEDERFSIKIMSPNHFAVVEMFREQPDSLFFAAVGTYSSYCQKFYEKREVELKR